MHFLLYILCKTLAVWSPNFDIFFFFFPRKTSFIENIKGSDNKYQQVPKCQCRLPKMKRVIKSKLNGKGVRKKKILKRSVLRKLREKNDEGKL